MQKGADVMLEHFSCCQQSRHIQTGSRSNHTCHGFEIISFIWRILQISIYRIIVYVQIEAYLSTTVKLFVLVAFVMGDISTWSSVTLVSRSPFLSKIPYSFHLINISKTRQLLYQISPNQSTLVGPHLTEKRLIMWVLYVTLTRVQTSHWWLELHVPDRKIGACWVIWMI